MADYAAVFYLLIYLAILLLEGLCTAFYHSFEAISEMDFEELKEKHHHLAVLEKLYENKPRKMMQSYQFITIGFALFSGVLSLKFFQMNFTAYIGIKQDFLITLCVYASLLVFTAISVFLPYSLATHLPGKFLVKQSYIFRFFEICFYPSILAAEAVMIALAKIFGINALDDGIDVTEEEIISMVNEGHEQGVLLASEAEMIQNIFAFDDKDAKDIMTHRKDIFALDGEMKLADAIHVFNENHYSRLPVYVEDLDNIIGIIHMKEMLDFSLKTDCYDIKLRDLDGLSTKAAFVPETHGINTLFRQMQLQKMHMVIVTDEYGQTSGLISFEDILEEIVGNIQDEHDNELEPILKMNETTYVMYGRTLLSDVCEKLDITLHEADEEFETLNGFLISQIDKIPMDHCTFSVDAYGYHFEVLDVEARMIQKVRVLKIKS